MIYDRSYATWRCNAIYESCECPDIMFVKAVGFQGEYSSDDLGEWLNDTAGGLDGDVGDNLWHIY